MCTKTQGLEDSHVSWHKMHFHQIARKASIVSKLQSRAPSIPLPITSNHLHPRFKPVPTKINTQSSSSQLSRARSRRISLQTPLLAEQHQQTLVIIAPCIIISPPPSMLTWALVRNVTAFPVFWGIWGIGGNLWGDEVSRSRRRITQAHRPGWHRGGHYFKHYFSLNSASF